MGTYATTTTLDLVMVGVNFSATDMSTLASKAIDHAEAEVNKYLTKRYDLSQSAFQTATSVPPLVRTLTERCAEGYLWQWLSRGSKESISRGKELVKGAQENLQLIADRGMELVNTAGSVITEKEDSSFSVQCSTTDYASTFNEDAETAWAIDSDKLDDIADGRD